MTPDPALPIEELTTPETPLTDDVREGALSRKWIDIDIMSEERAAAELDATLEELRTSNEERRRLLSCLVRAEEEQRRRIATGVHGDTIQKMVAAQMRLDVLRQTVADIGLGERSAEVDDLFAAANESLLGAVRRLRHLVFELWPETLDTSGLAAAIAWYMQEQDGVGVTAEQAVVSNLTREPPENARITLFRIAQEALANARKHARASRITVFLDERDGGFSVQVRDDGVGFDPKTAEPAPGHLGLMDMRHRVELADGRCDVRSSPGTGTIVEAWLPEAAG